MDSNEDRPWTDEELEASVHSYMEMLQWQTKRKRYVKKDYYRALAQRFGRTEKAFEYRMQNISYVLSLHGREWLDGLLPAKNVGAEVGAKLESFIAEFEDSHWAALVWGDIEVRKRLAKPPSERPVGKAVPEASVSTVTSFQRDPAVKAWVLQRAAGKCEACSVNAPFIDAGGLPFLEVHHVRQLADGGSDGVTNAVALCPNCHRRLHYAKDKKEYREELFYKVSELVRE